MRSEYAACGACWLPWLLGRFSFCSFASRFFHHRHRMVWRMKLYFKQVANNNGSNDYNDTSNAYIIKRIRTKTVSFVYDTCSVQGALQLAHIHCIVDRHSIHLFGFNFYCVYISTSSRLRRPLGGSRHVCVCAFD